MEKIEKIEIILSRKTILWKPFVRIYSYYSNNNIFKHKDITRDFYGSYPTNLNLMADNKSIIWYSKIIKWNKNYAKKNIIRIMELNPENSTWICEIVFTKSKTFLIEWWFKKFLEYIFLDKYKDEFEKYKIKIRQYTISIDNTCFDIEEFIEFIKYLYEIYLKKIIIEEIKKEWFVNFIKETNLKIIW